MTGRDPLIHVGYYKTGTTWLQIHLFGARNHGFAPIAPPDVTAPKLAAKHLGSYFFTDARGQILSPFEDRNAEARACRDRWSEPARGVPVVSHQRLVGNPFAGGFDAPRIAERLADAFPRARILIMVREQIHMIYSTYMQFLRCGGLESISGFLNRPYDNRLPGFSLAYFRYSALVARYMELFGQDSVCVLPYELFTTEPQRFVQEICNFAGAAPPADLDLQRRENVHPSSLVEHRSRLLNVFAHRTSLNGYSPYRSGATARVIGAGRWLAGRLVPDAAERRFRAATLRTLEQSIPRGYFTEDNRALERLTGLDLRAYGYDLAERRPDPTPLPSLAVGDPGEQQPVSAHSHGT